MQMGISGPSKHLEPEGEQDEILFTCQSCTTEDIAVFHPLHTRRQVGITLIPSWAVNTAFPQSYSGSTLNISILCNLLQWEKKPMKNVHVSSA